MSKADIHLVDANDEIEHQFRSVMRRLAGGVVVITAGRGDDIAGMTVTSLTSLSATPPRLLVSINRQASSFPLIERYRTFGVNILGSDQQALADRFSNGRLKGRQRFEGAAPARWQLARSVAQLRVSREETHRVRRDGEPRRAPSRDALETILNGLTEALFPRHYGQSDLDGENIDYFVGNTLSIVLDSLCDQIHRGALFVGDELLPGFHREDAVELTRSFASQLPAVRGLLISDLRAAFVGDPAAR